MGKNIPIYSINQFKPDSVKKKYYQVEVFNKNRNFKVEYPHRHDNFYEVLLITEGTGTYTIDFKEYPILPGYIYFVSPGQVHTINYSEDINGFIFLFTSEFFLADKPEANRLTEFPFFHSVTSENPPLKVADQSHFENLFKLACNESKEENPENDNITRSILELILHLCKKYYPTLEEDQYKGKGRMLVKRFKLLVEVKFDTLHSVQEYSTLLAVTANHLNETVKDITGLTAKEHIKERQLLEIKRLLSHSDLNISEIAYKLNFQDQSYFSRFFKKYAGVTPNEFRNKASGIE